MKVVIAGSRTARYADVIEAVDWSGTGRNITEVVCGMARGADSHGKEWAQRNNISVKEFPADWDKYGKSAGFIRNKEMAEYADAAIVCWDGKSRGSVNMIEEMKRLGKPVFVWQFKPH